MKLRCGKSTCAIKTRSRDATGKAGYDWMPLRDRRMLRILTIYLG
jgi:hypothetical protein